MIPEICLRQLLTENEVVRPEDLTESTGPHRVHGAGLKIDQNSAGDVFAT